MERDGGVVFAVKPVSCQIRQAATQVVILIHLSVRSNHIIDETPQPRSIEWRLLETVSLTADGLQRCL